MQELRIEVEGRTILLRDETVVQVGRDVPDGIVVHGESVSRVHAELRRAGRVWTLVDLGSRNGTYVDGERIGEKRISAPVTAQLGLPSSGASLAIHPKPGLGENEASPAGMNAAYAETMVAADMGGLDLGDESDPDDDSDPSGPNLVVQVGTATVAFPHSATVSIGRMPDNDVVIADPACSRIHGYVEPTGDSWVYRNVSSHGTYHRGESIETVTLDIPVVLKLGHPETGPRIELSHRGMDADVATEPTDPRRVFEVGGHRISRRLVYGILVVALYLTGAVLAVAYSTR